MNPGDEWLIGRELRVALIDDTILIRGDQLTDQDIEAFKKRALSE